MINASTAEGAEYRHLRGKAQNAAQGGHDAWSVMSTGEKLAVAIILNRSDWLVQMDYTMAEAINRIGVEWMALIPRIERELRDEGLL